MCVQSSGSVVMEDEAGALVPAAGNWIYGVFLMSLTFQSQSLQEKGKLSSEENANDSEVPSSSGIDSSKSRDKDVNEGMLKWLTTSIKY